MNFCENQRGVIIKINSLLANGTRKAPEEALFSCVGTQDLLHCECLTCFPCIGSWVFSVYILPVQANEMMYSTLQLLAPILYDQQLCLGH